MREHKLALTKLSSSKVTWWFCKRKDISSAEWCYWTILLLYYLIQYTVKKRTEINIKEHNYTPVGSSNCQWTLKCSSLVYGINQSNKFFTCQMTFESHGSTFFACVNKFLCKFLEFGHRLQGVHTSCIIPQYPRSHAKPYSLKSFNDDCDKDDVICTSRQWPIIAPLITYSI